MHISSNQICKVNNTQLDFIFNNFPMVVKSGDNNI